MERWSGPFPTANVAGTEAAAILLGALILSGWAWTRRGTAGSLALALGTVLILMAALALAATGSRAGALASVLGVVALLQCRAVRPWIAAGAVGLLLLCELCAPVVTRYQHLLQDLSLQNRVILWKATLGIIRDHPGTGVGRAGIVPLLNDWYLPLASYQHYASPLNETLMAAAAWGLPFTALLLTAYFAFLGLGLRQARMGSRLAAAGVALLVVSFTTGQFQAHAFFWWQSQLGWLLGFACVAASRPGGDASRQALGRGALLGAGLAIVVGVLAWGMATNPWSTSMVGGKGIGIRRGEVPAMLVVLVEPAAINRSRRQVWRDRRGAEPMAMSFLSSVPDAQWWSSLRVAYGGIRSADLLAVASGAEGEELLRAWSEGQLAGFSVHVSDLEDFPALAGVDHDPAEVQIRVARYAPFVDLDLLKHACQANGLEPPREYPGESSAYWHVWP